jgi:hypothetical protein
MLFFGGENQGQKYCNTGNHFESVSRPDFRVLMLHFEFK